MIDMPVDPERAFMKALRLDVNKLSKEDLLTVYEYMFYSECGLSYDYLVALISQGEYVPSDEALILIKQAGILLGITYPNLSC
ncbi:MAG: hypothetical protein ABL903_20685 [Methylococcales bacterium]|jgi:uncharacterized protein YuzB (UPF0349 family)